MSLLPFFDWVGGGGWGAGPAICLPGLLVQHSPDLMQESCIRAVYSGKPAAGQWLQQWQQGRTEGQEAGWQSGDSLGERFVPMALHE